MTSSRPLLAKLATTTALAGTLIALALVPTAANAQLTNNAPGAAAAKTDVPADQPWMDSKLSAEARADLILNEMTLSEKLHVTFC